MDAELFHSGEQRSPIQSEACGSSIVATYATFGFGKCADDRVTLPLGMLVNGTMSHIESIYGLFYDLRNLLPPLRSRWLRKFI
jgi:hypothetical protein